MSKTHLMVLAALLALPLSAKADHEQSADILNQWSRMAPRLHQLKPAQQVRALPVSPDREAGQRIAEKAKPYLDGAMSLLLLENGAVVHEAYSNGAAADRQLNSYSVAKSLTALAVGEALCAGKLASLDDPASKYAPQLEGTAYGSASLRNLLRMTSGAPDPGGNGYVGIHNVADLRAMLMHQVSLLDLLRKYGDAGRSKQGEKFIYNGMDSNALGMVIRGATGMSLAAWFEASVWQQAGAESPAGWYQDRDKNTVAEILFFATTRDFARIGLYIAERLSDKAGDACIREFMKEAAKPLVSKPYWDGAPAWGLGLHVGADGNTWLFGHGGQRVAIDVKTNRILATNGFRDQAGSDRSLRGIMAR